MKNLLDAQIILRFITTTIALLLVIVFSGVTIAEEVESNNNIGIEVGEIYDMGSEYITIDDMGFRFAKSIKFLYENGKEARKRYFGAGMKVEFSYFVDNNEIFEMRIVNSESKVDDNEAIGNSKETKGNKEKTTTGGGIYLKDGVWQN